MGAFVCASVFFALAALVAFAKFVKKSRSARVRLVGEEVSESLADQGGKKGYGTMMREASRV